MQTIAKNKIKYPSAPECHGFTSCLISNDKTTDHKPCYEKDILKNIQNLKKRALKAKFRELQFISQLNYVGISSENKLT